MLFLPELNAVKICDVCGSFDCPDCHQLVDGITSGSGQRLSSKTLTLSMMSTLTLLAIAS